MRGSYVFRRTDMSVRNNVALYGGVYTTRWEIRGSRVKLHQESTAQLKRSFKSLASGGGVNFSFFVVVCTL